MPKRIVPQFRICETCPAPECNLSESDVEQFVEEFEIYVALLASGFRRRDQFEWGGIYLNGLLGDTPRKTSEGMALDLNANVRDLQHFIGQSPWQKEPVLVIHQRLIGETLGEVDGVMLIDESGVVKQGQHSVGVAPQYCGSVGKVANAQMGVHLGYVSRLGYSLVDSQMFVPDAWFEETHAALRKACGIPREVSFQTKPEIGLQLDSAALGENVDRRPSRHFRRQHATAAGFQRQLWSSACPRVRSRAGGWWRRLLGVEGCAINGVLVNDVADGLGRQLEAQDLGKACGHLHRCYPRQSSPSVHAPHPSSNPHPTPTPDPAGWRHRCHPDRSRGAKRPASQKSRNIAVDVRQCTAPSPRSPTDTLYAAPVPCAGQRRAASGVPSNSGAAGTTRVPSRRPWPCDSLGSNSA